MRQRLRVAFAVLFDPAIVLLDEPFLGLDVEGREIVHGLVDSARRRGAVVLASNDERDFVGPERRIELGAGRRPHGMSLPARGSGPSAPRTRAQELRRRIATLAVLFFAATALALISLRDRPLRAARRRTGRRSRRRCSGSSSSSRRRRDCRAPSSRRRRPGPALALRKTLSGSLVLAGKTLFNFGLFLAIAAVVIPGFFVLLDWKVGRRPARSRRRCSSAATGSRSSRPSSRP